MKRKSNKKRLFRGYNIVLKYALWYKKEMFWAISLAFIYYALEFLNPYLTGRLTDVFSVSGEKGKETAILIGIIVLLNALDIFILRVKMRISNVLTMQVYADFVVDQASHLLDLPLSYHNSKKIGSVLNRLANAGEKFFDILENIGFQSLPNLISLAVVVVLIFFLNPYLATILLVQIILFGFVTIKKTRGITIWQKKFDIKSDKAWGHIWDYMTNVILVKSSCNEKYEKEKSAGWFNSMLDTYKIHASMWRSLSSWQRFFMRYGYLATLCAALYMVRVSKVISFGEFIMFIGYANMAYTPLASLATQYRSLRKGLASIERTNRITTQKTEFELWPGKQKLEKVTGRIEFRNVVFGYNGEDVILDNISFVVEPGEMIAFVGKSGVGKTSIIDLVSGYYSIRSGQILIDDIDIKELDLRSLRDMIAHVSQDSLLFNDSLGHNIKYTNFSATKDELDRAVQMSAVDEFLNKLPLGFGTLVGERGIKLSGGQRQRIAIARAILRDKPIILLDEATSALDSVSEKLIQSSLKDLVRNRTTFVVAHRLSTILHADKIIVLDKGKIVETGNHEDLIQIPNGHYKKFFMIQSGTMETEPE